MSKLLPHSASSTSFASSPSKPKIISSFSNSSLTYLCEDQGGSRLKFKKRYIDGDLEQEVTPSLENGKIIHAYIESPDDFVIADIDKPSEGMSKLVENVYQTHGFGDLKDVNYDNNDTVADPFKCKRLSHKYSVLYCLIYIL